MTTDLCVWRFYGTKIRGGKGGAPGSGGGVRFGLEERRVSMATELSENERVFLASLFLVFLFSLKNVDFFL